VTPTRRGVQTARQPMLIIPVSDLCAMVREALESDPRLGDVWVMGEVSNLRRPSSGHIYFTLKDAYSQLRCAFFRRDNARSRVALDNGLQIVAHGYVSFYPANGDLQLYVDFVHEQGVGLLHLEFERLKERLAAEGLFDASRKRPLPEFPRRIGVVTSPDGAVLHDICHVLRRRWPLVEVLLAPTQVQGDGAVDGVCRAIDSLCAVRDVDVIIVARGGGSLEDLWTFNEERVARAIFAATVPVISAVGHETDYTIADFVADVRAPTPSAAAELVCPDRAEVAVRLQALGDALERHLAERLRAARADVAALRAALQRGRPDLAALRGRVEGQARWATEYFRRAIGARRAALDRQAARLQALSPAGTLARGYALVRRAPAGPVVRRVADAAPGDHLRVAVADGEFQVTVIE
jgi:exodeoxyribonuclease VII large subunit